MRSRLIRLGKGSLVAGVILAVMVTATFVHQPLGATWHLSRARRLLQDRENERALDELRAALRLAPDRAETLFLLARAHRRLGHADRVPLLLQRAEKMGGDPQRVRRETWLLLARTGRLREAEPHLAELLEDPGDDGPEICEAYVQGYFFNMRLPEAIRLLDAWQKDYPQDAQPCFMRGFLLQALDRTEEAVAAYRKGLRISPGDTVARCRLARALLEQNDLDEAAELLRRSADEAPRNPEVVTAWADCLFQQGNADQARRVLQQLFRDEPDYFEARRLAGEIEVALGCFEEALGHLEVAAAQRPYDTTTRNALGKALRGLGRADEAQRHFDYVARAEKPLSDMERQLQQVVKRPGDPELRYQIGVTLLQYGSPEDGAKWLRTVLQIDPNHEKARMALVGYYEARGDWESALALRRRAGMK